MFWGGWGGAWGRQLGGKGARRRGKLFSPVVNETRCTRMDLFGFKWIHRSRSLKPGKRGYYMNKPLEREFTYLIPVPADPWGFLLRLPAGM